MATLFLYLTDRYRFTHIINKKPMRIPSDSCFFRIRVPKKSYSDHEVVKCL